MNSGSSAFMRSGSHCVGWLSTTASYQRSRGICMSIAAPVWRTTSTVSTVFVPGILSAASTLALSGDLLAAAQALVGGDDQLAGAVGDAVGDRLRGEPAEHDRVDGADARAGQHRHRRLGNHRQVDGDAVALAHAERAQRIGQLAHARVQFAVADVLRGPGRVVVLEDQGGLVAARRQVAVQAVDAGVELAVLVPADVEVLEVVADVLDPRRRLEPVQALRDAAPERLRVASPTRRTGARTPRA